MSECTKEFEFLAESMPQMVWTKNPQGSREYLNKRWAEYTGLSVNDKDWDWTDVIHPDDYAKTVKYWDESLYSGKFFEFECRLKRKDGSYRWHLARAIPMADEENNITAWIGTCTDVDENKMREEELHKKNKALERINADLDSFIYTASHDLKAPISNIEGLITALQDDLKLKMEDNEKQLIQMIDISIGKLKDTIQELTEVVKVQKNAHNGDRKEIAFTESWKTGEGK